MVYILDITILAMLIFNSNFKVNKIISDIFLNLNSKTI